MMNKIDRLAADYAVRRGTGRIIEETEELLFAYDSLGDIHYIIAEDARRGMDVLLRHAEGGYRFLSVYNGELGQMAFREFGFDHIVECRQMAYYGEKPDRDPRRSVRAAGPEDLPLIKEHYQLLNDEVLWKNIERQNVLLGFHDGTMVGFVGEHVEGSLGMFVVFPEFRQMGYGLALEKEYLIRMMEKGEIPYCQVEPDNLPSMRLQEQLGMVMSENVNCWMYRDA